jgi:catechol 2,3-dioxygenase
MSDVAHLGPVELFTPRGEASLAFFVEVMGMAVEHQQGPSTYLRGWGDYQPWSLKLTASDTSGIGVLGLRAASPEALARRAALVERTGHGLGWTDGDRGRGPSYRFTDPDGHQFEPTATSASMCSTTGCTSGSSSTTAAKPAPG